MKSFFSLLLLFCIGILTGVNAQVANKKPLTTNDFANWKVINNPIVSGDGRYVSYEVNPQKGNGVLIVKLAEGKKEDVLPRGYGASFSSESDFIVYKIKQPVDSIRAAKKKKLKKEQMPKDSIGIFVFRQHKIYKYPNLKQYSLPKENATWVAFLTDMKKDKKKTDKEGDSGKKSASKTKKTENQDEKSQLVLFNSATGDTLCFQNISEFFYSQKGQNIAFIRQTKDSLDRSEVLVFDTKTFQSRVIFDRQGTAKKITTDPQGSRLGFVFSNDTAKVKTYSLYYGSTSATEPHAVVLPAMQGLPVGWAVSEFGDISFSDNGMHLFFGTNKIPQVEPKDTLLDDEKPVLDVWTYKDRELQPEQKVNLDKEKKRSYKAVFLVDKEKFSQLADPEVKDIRTIQKGNGHFALGIDQTPYKLASSWTGKSNADYYLIDLETGVKRSVIKNKSSVWLSPAGSFLVWYNQADSAYYSCPTNADKPEPVKLTKQLNVSFTDERWDMPGEPALYGIAGWSENDKYIFIYDRYDIWRFDLEGNKVPVSATRGYGRKNSLRFRYQKLDPDEETIDTNKPAIVSAFDERNKSAGYFQADLKNFAEPKLLLMEDETFSGLAKAKNADVLIWTREDVSESPNVWVSSLNFDHKHKLSDANPQQNQFVWPGVRLVHWNSFSGKPLEGLLYYPDNIDPEKKYPMIVYFYERNADYLNAYTQPSPTRSTVNRTFYTSNGYIVFIPDITYEDGFPGRSAFDAIISGTQFVSSMFPFIDRKKIGVQGQSWGGYQTAYLITQTNMFAAAGAGAPVSNMTSAYGGIRWESGVSREFQYEVSQSRIGGTLWEKPLNYIENSPLFYVPQITTPLLITHNDNDGAVPWYQGIELFTAMRRLNKPVWMLTYNNEEHNLKAESWANRMDLTIRMKQFFDHYLKDAPMPLWMKYGIPAVEKGKTLGY
ncbi:MAG TPA: prolyl oligopeptidase family serine peptidase [Prolixibacteraceae bacterium]|nr:prolyl oligopeptidase family serine peptidase [Prolixibacteraceae bacterium]